MYQTGAGHNPEEKGGRGRGDKKLKHARYLRLDSFMRDDNPYVIYHHVCLYTTLLNE